MSKLTRIYRKSHLIEAKYFIQDPKNSLVVEYSTNSHGKRIVNLTVKGQYDQKISLGSYKEVKALADLLLYSLEETRYRWLVEKKKEKKDEK